MRLVVLILITIVVFPQICSAEDFLPLQVGNRWEYTSTEGDETKEVTGTTELWGEEVFLIEYVESVNNIGLDQYWTTNAEGDAFVWGWWRDDHQYGVLYDPPIPWVDAPLYLGKTWSHVFDAYTLPDTAYAGQNEIGLEVYWEGVLTVPAGEFYSYGIGQYLPIGGGLLADHSITGELVVEQKRSLERGRRALERVTQDRDHDSPRGELGKRVAQPLRSLDRVVLEPALLEAWGGREVIVRPQRHRQDVRLV